MIGKWLEIKKSKNISGENLIENLIFYFQTNGKYKQKGRDYVVEDGDIIFFKFNAGAGLSAGKKK